MVVVMLEHRKQIAFTDVEHTWIFLLSPAGMSILVYQYTPLYLRLEENQHGSDM